MTLRAHVELTRGREARGVDDVLGAEARGMTFAGAVAALAADPRRHRIEEDVFDTRGATWIVAVTRDAECLQRGSEAWIAFREAWIEIELLEVGIVVDGDVIDALAV